MLIKKVGYWSINMLTSDSPFYLLENKSSYSKEKVTNYLKDGFRVIGWKEYKHCSFCCGAEGDEMGCWEFSDGEWIWPEELIHYVEHHYIDLPEKFISHIKANDYRLSIEEKKRKLLIIAKREFEKNLRFPDDFKLDESEWNLWLKSKKESVSPETIEELKNNITAFRSPKTKKKVTFKVPDEW